jgi:hypothetical protein
MRRLYRAFDPTSLAVEAIWRQLPKGIEFHRRNKI